MKSRILLVSLFIYFHWACSSDKGTPATKTLEIHSSKPKIDHFNKTKYFNDSTILLNNIRPSNTPKANLNDSIAKYVLYLHYKKKGYLISEELKKTLSDTYTNKMAISYFKIDKVDLNNNNYSYTKTAIDFTDQRL